MANNNTDNVKPNNKVIWLVNDDRSTPYEHHLDDDCECFSCQKKSRIILLN